MRVILTWLLHRRVATTHFWKHNKTRKNVINHWAGVESTYHASTTIRRFIKFLEKQQFPRLYRAVTNYRIFTIISHTFDIKNFHYLGPFHTNWAKRKVITEKWPDNVWTCERIPKHWCLHEKSNLSSDRLSRIKTVSKTTYCIFRGKTGQF